MKKKILILPLMTFMFMLLAALIAISAGTALPTAVFASEGNKALAPVDETLYWGYNSDTKVFYFSKTDTAITEEGVTSYSFDSTIAYGDVIKPWDSVDNDIAHNLTKIKILNDITPGQTSGWFREMYSLAEIDGIEKLNTSNVTDMSLMFNGCYALEDVDLSHFDTSNVTDIGCMFWECTSLKSLDLSNFDTSNVTDMGEMFHECEALESLDVSNFDTSNVTNMAEMFANCYALKSLDVSSFNTSNVVRFAHMFYQCRVLKSLDLSNFQLSGVTKEASDGTGLLNMFAGCAQLTELDLSSFDTSNITILRGMFDSCSALRSVNLSSFDTSNVTDMRDMFKNCTSLMTLDLSNFDCSNVEAGDLFRLTSLPSYKYTLASLKTPKNLKVDMKVPGINSSLYWYNADTLDVYDNAYLPKDSANSVTLAAGVLADSWSSLQDAINASSGTPTEPADKITPIILKNDLVAPTEGGSSITVTNGKNIVINLNGNVLNANGRSFSAINVIEGGKLTIIDTMPTAEHYFTVGDDGLWTLTNTKTETTKTITGGIITGGNNNGGNGGGVYVDAGGSFTMKDGNIAGNTAYNGGGVYNSGTFTMTGGTISGNKAINSYGGGVFINGTSTMTGGTISGNIAKNVGGVYVGNDKTLTLGGTAVISGNTSSKGKANDLFLLGTATIGTGDKAPKTGMYIGLNAGKITNAKASDVKYFFPNNKNSYIKFIDGDNSLMSDLIPDGSYLITVNSSDHGVVCADKQIMTSGETVTITVNPAEGFQLKSLKYNDGTTDYDITKDATTGEYQFTMPAKAVTVTAEFELHVHAIKTTHAKVEAKCVEAGHEAYYECDCGKCFSDQSLTQQIENLETWLGENGDGYIAPIGHDIDKVNGTPATEGADGFKDAYKCNNCGKYFEDEPATKLIGDEAAYNAWKLGEGKIPALKVNGLSGGAIAGIVIGIIFGLLIIAFAVLYILWKRKNFNVPFLCKVLTPAFRFINKLFFKTKLNDVEAKEAENKEMKE